MGSNRTTIKTKTYDDAKAARTSRMEINIHQPSEGQRNEIEKDVVAFAADLKKKYGIEFSVEITESIKK